MSQAVCLLSVPTSLATRADCEDVSGGPPLRGAARGVCTVPFAAVLWGCLRRFACFLPQHPSLGERIVRMSQAGRPLRGIAEGYGTVPFAAVLWGCLRRF